jgi:hypothetical protein
VPRLSGNADGDTQGTYIKAGCQGQLDLVSADVSPAILRLFPLLLVQPFPSADTHSYFFFNQSM